MTVTKQNKMRGMEIAASLFAPVAPEDFYRAVLDVRGFPAWAPGVRRVEVLSGEGEAGMLSEWEVSFLGIRKRVTSVLRDAEAPSLLRWTYEGPVEGWGECSVEALGDGTVAAFRTDLAPADPLLARLIRGDSAKNAARAHLKHSLKQLGRLVSEDPTGVLVGPITDERAHRLPVPRNTGRMGLKPAPERVTGRWPLTLVGRRGGKKMQRPEGPEGPSPPRRPPDTYSK
jgi:hypothetical protein